MPWLQIKFEITSEHADELAETLNELGAEAVTFQDSANQPLYEPPLGTTPLWNQTTVVGLFSAQTNVEYILSQIRSRLDESFLNSYQLVPLEDQEWEKTWMDGFHPMQFGDGLWICPSWSTIPNPDATNIILDPGLAFGTGTHPTTALCLEWLDQHPPLQRQVIDYGCGSGVLALACAKLGAARIWAIDNDPQALQATKANAEKNGISSEFLSVCFPEELPAIKIDLLIANILANPLIELAPRFAQLLTKDATIVLSGILLEQKQIVMEAYTPWFQMGPPIEAGEWLLLQGTRKP